MSEVVAGEIRTEWATSIRRGDAGVARVDPPRMLAAGSPVSRSFRIGWERGRRGRRPYCHIWDYDDSSINDRRPGHWRRDLAR